MTIFSKDGILYTITRNLFGRCMCGKCCGKYTATEYNRPHPKDIQEFDIKDYKPIGER